jgi:BirA family biotin operon repressor/biotin-[acetyl-CoA-carboxylase] ligase
MTTSLDPGVLRQHLGERLFGRRIHHFPRIDSTNDRALAMMEGGEPEGTLVLAEEQIQGRGRRQRAWHSPPGLGIYASLILRPSLQADLLPLVSFAAAVGAVVALESLSLTGARIKWPNDILLGGKKAGGLLAEARGDGPGVGVVVGLGLNVNQEEKDFPPELRGRITSLLLESGRVWDRQRILWEILLGWEREHEKLLEQGPGDLLADFERFSAFAVGARLRIDPEGEAMQGHYAGLGPRGELLLRTAEGAVRSLTFGEIALVREE